MHENSEWKDTVSETQLTQNLRVIFKASIGFQLPQTAKIREEKGRRQLRDRRKKTTHAGLTRLSLPAIVRIFGAKSSQAAFADDFGPNRVEDFQLPMRPITQTTYPDAESRAAQQGNLRSTSSSRYGMKM